MNVMMTSDFRGLMARRFMNPVKGKRFHSSGQSWLLGLFLFGLVVLGAPSVDGAITYRDLKVTEKKIKDLVRGAMPATVAITPERRSGPFATGSGVIVNPDGLVLTAAHVALGMNDRVIVTFPDGSKAKGRVLGMDYTRDSGMIQLEKNRKYPFVSLGDSDSLIENDWCVALGHAGGFQADRPPPVRLGRVILNNPKRFIMTDSALISGDSGGPLFDLEGRLVGIHSNIGTSLSQNNHVPLSAIRKEWGKLLAGERFGGDERGAVLSNPDRPMIGAVLADAPQGRGAFVVQIAPDSPAAKAGLRKGDRIIEADSVSIDDSDELIAEIRNRKSGETMKLLVASSRGRRTVSVKLTSSLQLKGYGPETLRPSYEPRTAEETRKLQEEFNQKMRLSIETGQLQLTPGDYEKFQDADDFNDFMARFRKELTPRELDVLVRIAVANGETQIRPGEYDPDKAEVVGDPFFRDVLDAFRPSVARTSDATHLVFRGREWKSLCTVVHEMGYALTKASEIQTENNQKLTVMLSKDELAPATVVKVYREFDLALIRIDTERILPAVNWEQPRDLPGAGTLLSAAGSGPDPVAIGVISVMPRSLSKATKGFLGVVMSEVAGGVKVVRLTPDGNARKAGVLRDDVITKVNGVVCDNPDKLLGQISTKPPGSTVDLEVKRRGRIIKIDVTLGSREGIRDRFPEDPGGTNQMGTDLSEKRSGFPRALQTDLPIEPEHCGGPLVDLNGNFLGINIARAGRIKTYAITAEEIRQLIGKYSFPQELNRSLPRG